MHITTFEELETLLGDFGGSVYIAHPEVYQANATRLLSSFSRYYPKTALGYSYKTNYLPSLCLLANAMNSYAEVVSGLEYQMARRLGISGDRIIFNGPAKRREDLHIALVDGAMINIDNLNELTIVESILSDCPEIEASLGIRCNLRLQYEGQSSRFGLNCETGEFWQAVKRIEAIENAKLIGLHSHFSYDRSVEGYGERMEQMHAISDEVFSLTPPRYINIGGGFCGPMPPFLIDQIGGNVPCYEDYAKVIASLMNEKYGPDGPELILESGVGLVSDAMQFVCQVIAIKELPGRRVAVTTGSYQNIRPCASKINMPIDVFSSSERKASDCPYPTDIVGYTCIESDVIFKQYEKNICVGDIIVFNNIGAYSFVFKPPFIDVAPPIVQRISDKRGWKCLRRRQTVDDIFKGFDV